MQKKSTPKKLTQNKPTQKRIDLLAATLLAAILLSGCSSVSPSPTQPTLPPVEDSSTETEVRSTPSDSITNPEIADEKKPNAASNSAAMLLLAQSESLRTEGKSGQAIAMVERAIRLEPSNGDLWVQLGRLNFETNDYARAEQYARRGIALTRADTDTQKQGWLLLADVSEARGDLDGATQIRARWLNTRG